MNTEMALAQLGISIADLTPEQKRKFDEDGYFVVENVFTPAEVAEMRSEFERLRSIEGEYGGHEVHIEPGAPRLSNLFNKSPAFDRCLSCTPTLAAAAYLLGEIRVYSLNARNPLKGQGQQPLHSDVPRVTPTDWRVVNSMVMLDDMTETNGATRSCPAPTSGCRSTFPTSIWRRSNGSRCVLRTRRSFPRIPWRRIQRRSN